MDLPLVDVGECLPKERTAHGTYLGGTQMVFCIISNYNRHDRAKAIY